MYSRIDSDPKFHADQLAKAQEMLFRRGDADRKHRDWMRTRPGAQLMDTMYRRFHGLDVNPFHQIESLLPSEAEAQHLAQVSDEMGGAA